MTTHPDIAAIRETLSRFQSAGHAHSLAADMGARSSRDDLTRELTAISEQSEKALAALGRLEAWMTESVTKEDLERWKAAERQAKDNW